MFVSLKKTAENNDCETQYSTTQVKSIILPKNNVTCDYSETQYSKPQVQSTCLHTNIVKINVSETQYSKTQVKSLVPK